MHLVAMTSIRVPSAKDASRTGRRTRERWSGNVNERAGFHVERGARKFAAAMRRVVGHSELGRWHRIELLIHHRPGAGRVRYTSCVLVNDATCMLPPSIETQARDAVGWFAGIKELRRTYNLETLS